MGDKFEDLTGRKFERLTILKQDSIKKAYWWCECSCENKTIKLILAYSLLNGKTKSCGCLRKEATRERAKNNRKYNIYDLTGEYGIGYTSNTNEPFYFDLEDYDLIKDYCWRIDTSKGSSKGYINSLVPCSRKIVKLHRIVMHVTEKTIQVDHIYHIRHDNRKTQLRIVSNSQNCMNKGLRKDNTSGVAGVCWQENEGCWRVQIQINKVKTYIGKFTNFEDAVKIRKEAEEKYYGQYSYDNSMLNKNPSIEEQNNFSDIP